MNRIIFPFLLIVFGSIEAQTYIPTLQQGATWSILKLDGSSPSFSKFKIIGDTVINSLIYNKLYRLDNNGLPVNFTLFREANEKVYYYSLGIFPGGGNTYDYINFQDNLEYLFYDYSLSIGDTVPSTYITSSFVNQNIVYTVDAIDSVFIGGQYHKRFLIDPDGCDQESIIEGLGSTRGLIYPSNIYCPSYEFALLCYELDTIQYTTEYSIQNFNSACSVSVGIEENPSIIFTIYPNPAQDYMSIEIPNNYTNIQLSIYNLTWQLISQKHITHPYQQIPISELSNGMYIFVIQNADKFIGRQRVVVAR